MDYKDKIVKRFENPKNVGSLDKNDENVGIGLVGAPSCGDLMKLSIKINPETEIIEEAKFLTFGCGAAISSSDLVCELIKNKGVSEAENIKNVQIVEELSLPP